MDGRKTWIGLVLTGLGLAFTEGAAMWSEGFSTERATKVVGGIMTAIGAAHKIWKDYQAAKTKAAEGVK